MAESNELLALFERSSTASRMVTVPAVTGADGSRGFAPSRIRQSGQALYVRRDGTGPCWLPTSEPCSSRTATGPSAGPEAPCWSREGAVGQAGAARAGVEARTTLTTCAASPPAPRTSIDAKLCRKGMPSK